LRRISRSYVVFKDSELLFLKPAFRHCFLIRGLLLHETIWFRTKTTKITPERKREILNRYVMVEVLALKRFKGLTCVSCVKRSMGIEDRRIITPYQLYKQIRK
jgi:hypothetical protein